MNPTPNCGSGVAASPPEAENRFAGEAHAAAPPVPPGMDIGWAVQALRAGAFVRRRGWNGKGMFLQYQQTRMGACNSEPYLRHHALGEPIVMAEHVIMFTANRQYVPWLCSQTDLLATDWEIAS